MSRGDRAQRIEREGDARARRPVPLDGGADPAKAAPEGLRCPLCGAAMPEDREGCAPGCPLAHGCRVLCCSACGYEFVTHSSIVEGVGRVVRFFRRIKNDRAAKDR